MASAAAALVWSKYPQLTGSQLVGRLLATVDGHGDGARPVLRLRDDQSLPRDHGLRPDRCARSGLCRRRAVHAQRAAAEPSAQAARADRAGRQPARLVLGRRGAAPGRARGCSSGWRRPPAGWSCWSSCSSSECSAGAAGGSPPSLPYSNPGPPSRRAAPPARMARPRVARATCVRFPPAERL